MADVEDLLVKLDEHQAARLHGFAEQLDMAPGFLAKLFLEKAINDFIPGSTSQDDRSADVVRNIQEASAELARSATSSPDKAPVPENGSEAVDVANALLEEVKSKPWLTGAAVRYGKRLGELGRVRLYAGLLNIDGDMPWVVIASVLSSPDVPAVMKMSNLGRKAMENISENPRNIEICRALGFDEARIEAELQRAGGSLD